MDSKLFYIMFYFLRKSCLSRKGSDENQIDFLTKNSAVILLLILLNLYLLKFEPSRHSSSLNLLHFALCACYFSLKTRFCLQQFFQVIETRIEDTKCQKEQQF